MARVIRPIASWLALLNRLRVPPMCEQDYGFVQRMKEKLGEGWQLSDAEADKVEKLRDQYGEKV